MKSLWILILKCVPNVHLKLRFAMSRIKLPTCPTCVYYDPRKRVRWQYKQVRRQLGYQWVGIWKLGPETLPVTWNSISKQNWLHKFGFESHLFHMNSRRKSTSFLICLHLCLSFSLFFIVWALSTLSSFLGFFTLVSSKL